MNDTIDFDAEAARRVERAYLTPDIVAQRHEVLRELDPQPGETVLDIGVGPGLLAKDLAEAVGSNGRMTGIDASAPMVEMSRQRCSETPWAHLEVADASVSMPFSYPSGQSLGGRART